MKTKILVSLAFVFIALCVSAQQSLMPIEFNGSTGYAVITKDTVQMGRANTFGAGFTFRSKNINFNVSADYVSSFYDTTANDRLKLRGSLANAQFGYLGSGIGYYERFYNEISLGYEFFLKADHYISLDNEMWRKETTSHGIFASERFGISSDGHKDGTFKVFREQELSAMVMYAFSTRMCTTLGDDTIKSPLATEDTRSFFFDFAYKAEVLGISFRNGKAGIGANFYLGYSNLTPFGSFPGYKVGGSLSLSSYGYVGKPIEVYYRYTGLGKGAFINEVGVSIDICGLYYTFRK